MKFILIIMFYASGSSTVSPAVVQQEFNSRKSCHAAYVELLSKSQARGAVILAHGCFEQ